MRRSVLLLTLLLAAAPVSAQEAEVGDAPATDLEPGSEPPADTAPAVDSAPADAAPAATPSPGPLVVVLSLGGDASASAARAARQAVAEALRADGMTVMPDGDVDLAVSPARQRACRGTSCAYEIGRQLSASMTAAVATWRGETDATGSLTVSLITAPDRSHSATVDVVAGDVAAAALAAVREAQTGRRRSLLIEGAPHVDPEPAPSLLPDESVLNRDRSLEEWILPSLLGVVGLGLIGLGAYALLDETCEVQGATVCLRGDRPNVGLGVVTTVLGGLSIAGAILWLVVGGQAQPGIGGNIDVVLGPDGGAVSVRGVF